MEEERRWKKEGEGGIRRGIEWLKRGEFLQSNLGKRNFPEEGSKEGDGTEREENWRRGLTPGEELHSSNKEVAIGFIGTWARGLGNPSVS